MKLNLNLKGSYVLDTSVVVEYLDESSPFRLKVEEVYLAIGLGEIKAYLTPLTVSETLYVASRIYREAGSKKPNKDAEELVNWLLSYPSVKLVELTREVAMLAGEIRKTVRISLIDCYVLAASKVLGAKPLFLKLEREMEQYMDNLRRYNIHFLVSY